MGILNVLRATQSNSKPEREAAEEWIANAARTEALQLLETLFTVVSDPNVSVPEAQSGALVLKNVVMKHWSAGFDPYEGVPFDPAVKAAVRTRLLEVVAHTPRPQVRAAIASVIARIAALEYPDEWPDLLNQTLEMINSESTLAGGLALFKELLIDTVREEDFFSAGHMILKRLYEAAQQDDYRLAAIQCYHECINFFLMGDDDQLPILESFAKEYLSRWNQLFAELITLDPSTDIQFEIINTLRDQTSAFPDLMRPDIPMLFQRLFERLEGYTEADSPELAAAQTDFLEYCIEGGAGKSILRYLSDPAQLERAVDLCLLLSQLPTELQYLWADDMNEFVSQEVDLNVDAWPRPSAGSLIGVIREPQLFKTLLERCRASKNWVNSEACLYLLSCALEQVAVESQALSPENVTEMLELGIRPNEPELLAARSIILGGYLAKYMNYKASEDAKLEALSRAVKVDLGVSNVIKVACLKTIGTGCDIFQVQMVPYQEHFLTIIESLLPEAEDDTPAFLSDVFSNVLRLDFDKAIRFPVTFSMFFALAGKDTANVELNVDLLSLVEELLNHFESNPEATNLIFSELLSPVLEILSASRANGFEYSSDLQFALDLATVVFERGADIPDKRRLLDVFYDLVSRCQDPQIVQAGSFAYAALVERVGSGQLNDEEIQQALSVAAKLLDPDLDDSAALASGRLVTAIIDNFGQEIGGVLSELLIATARRLQTAENALLVESLTMVFCQLILRNALAVVDILANDNDLLVPVMKKWISAFEIVRGVDEIYKSVCALETIYDLHDPRVDSIMVDDQAIAPRDVILTRSKTRNLQFTKIPLPLKIIKLLIKELAQAPVPDDNDDDEWDDEEAIGEDGTKVVDQRIYRLILGWFKKIGSQSMAWYSKLTEQERVTLMEAARLEV